MTASASCQIGWSHSAFAWSDKLEEAFCRSKVAIVDEIHHGVEIFNARHTTCLRMDYSTKGISYFLLQKHCNCNSQLPECCNGGWQIASAGSHFLPLS